MAGMKYSTNPDTCRIQKQCYFFLAVKFFCWLKEQSLLVLAKKASSPRGKTKEKSDYLISCSAFQITLEQIKFKTTKICFFIIDFSTGNEKYSRDMTTLFFPSKVIQIRLLIYSLYLSPEFSALLHLQMRVKVMGIAQPPLQLVLFINIHFLSHL